MKRVLLLALLLLGMVALGMVLLLEPASAPRAAAYDGEARATMSCTDNISTMTRTAVVTVTWTGVGINRMEAQAWGGSPTVLLGSGSIFFPPAKKGTESLTFSFNDTTLFGNVQWQLYNEAIAPIQAGQLDAANFPGCPYP
jgi:hypothetical protein